MSTLYYVYVLIREDDETPFYVGLSHRETRMNEHVYVAKKRNKTHKDHIILKLLREVGHVPFIIAVKDVDKETAVRTEMNLIRHYERRPIGPLVNETDGGDGVSGY